MEIIAELLLNLFVAVLQIVVEAAGDILLELLAEVGFRSLAEPFRRPRPAHPALAALGYALYGAAAGGVSLLIPKLLAVPHWVRLVNFVVSPLACGLVMAAVGRARTRRGKQTIRLDTFAYGYLFALAMVSVRLVWRR